MELQKEREEKENLKKQLESFTSVNRTEQENKELVILKDQLANYDKTMKERNTDFEINENKLRMEVGCCWYLNRKIISLFLNKR